MTQFLHLLPSGLAFAWLLSKAQWFWAHNPDLQFGWVVVLLCGYLLFEASEQCPQARFAWRWPHLLLLAGGLAWLFVVQIYQAAMGVNAASLLGLALGIFLVIGANLLGVFGWPGLRHFGFGFGFILLALPLPSAVQNPLLSNLQSLVAWINVEILNLCGIPAQRQGSLIQLTSGIVGIDEACSGIRSLQSTIMATLFIGYLILKNNWLRTLLLGFGISLAVFGNIVRSLFLSLTAHRQGLLSVETAHDTAGWTILAFTGGGVALGAWLINKIQQRLELAATRAASQPPPL